MKPIEKKPVFEKPVYQRANFTSRTRFKNFFRTIKTKTPVLFPKTDEEVSTILKQANDAGLKVRGVGTGHTCDGWVQDLGEENVICVSMADYQVPSDWDYVLNELPLDAPANHAATIRMGGGRTFLDLMSYVRPKGYLLNTQTAGWIFSLAGVFLNPSVHGSGLNAERVCAMVVGLRVMLASGEIKEISDPVELKAWRGSMGLLGLVLGVEVKLRRDEGIKMEYFEQEIVDWNQENVNNFLRPIVNQYDSVEFYYFPNNDTIVAFAVKFNPGEKTPFDFTKTSVLYQKMKEELPNLSKPSHKIVKRHELFEVLCGWTGPLKPVSSFVLTNTKRALKEWWMGNYENGARDGFYMDLKKTIHYNVVNSYVPCKGDGIEDGQTFKTLDVTRSILKREWNHATNETQWLPIMPVEFRFVDIKPDVVLLEYLEPNTRYISIEMFSFYEPDRASNRQGPIFMEAERAWRKSAPDGMLVKGHLGKEWGYYAQDKVAGPVPFADPDMLDELFSQETREAFRKAMDKYDPYGTFRAGAGIRLLKGKAKNDLMSLKSSYYGNGWFSGWLCCNPVSRAMQDGEWFRGYWSTKNRSKESTDELLTDSKSLK